MDVGAGENLKRGAGGRWDPLIAHKEMETLVTVEAALIVHDDGTM